MNTLKVQKRNMETKAKKLRREGYVTGSLFGKDFEYSIPIKIEKKAAEKIQRECIRGSQLHLDLEGKNYDVLLKQFHYDPLRGEIMEMDFQALIKGEKVRSVAKIILHNKDKVTEGILEQLLPEISYTALPRSLVERIDIDCSTLRLGDTLKVSDLDIINNKEIEVTTHMDTPVLSVIAPHHNVVEEEEAQAEENA